MNIGVNIRTIYENKDVVGAVLSFNCSTIGCGDTSVRLNASEFEWLIVLQAPFEIACPTCKTPVKFNNNRFSERDN